VSEKEKRKFYSDLRVDIAKMADGIAASELFEIALTQKKINQD